jgi:hypothetical protein
MTEWHLLSRIGGRERKGELGRGMASFGLLFKERHWKGPAKSLLPGGGSDWAGSLTSFGVHENGGVGRGSEKEFHAR